MTTLAGVCGWPVKHSLSPLIHGAWLQAAGVDGAYERFEVAPEDFAAFVAEARGRLAGVNVTVPHKEAALALADTVSPVARAAGAANVLTFRDGAIQADNTDGVGLLAALAEQAGFVPTNTTRAVILGAGGAARGAAAALLAAGASVVVANRTVERAEALASELAALGSIQGVGEADVSNADVIVNATTLGLGGGAGPAVDLAAPRADCVVMDMVYKPLRTEFLERARALGRPAVDGFAMLIGQAAPSFEAFYGQPPDPTVNVRDLALKALGETA
ncbi:MAG: shikimate dehydrogenase [Caulobacterales bacterium]|nr:shikimate dehydrogenase [Caulobacterales bacterium]